MHRYRYTDTEVSESRALCSGQVPVREAGNGQV